MLQDIWQTINTMGIGAILGDWPGLPSNPLGTPEGFWFQGVSAWCALNDILDNLGFTIVCDLTQDNPYTIVTIGADDSTFTNLQTRFLGNLEDDLEWISEGQARVPRYITVYFRRRNSVYGTEETVTYGDNGLARQWDMTPLYSYTITAPVDFSSAVGTHFLWSDFTVRYDQDGLPVTADVTQAQAIAQERVTQYLRYIRADTDYMTQVYTGALPFVTGSQVDSVCYYQDGRNRDYYGGWRTKITRGISAEYKQDHASY